MNPSTASSPGIRRLAVAVRGIVQGVGFRPFVYNTARALGLGGWVVNETDTVRIEVQGDSTGIENFLDALRRAHPPQARIDSVEVRELPCANEPAGLFEIRASAAGAAPRPAIPADLATCRECLEEIRTPGARRRGYPFTNCTNCGPRWSIIEQLPYDRPRTSMARFAMCPQCAAEYENPADRRFHAQPIACPKCGPALRLLNPAGRVLARTDQALAGAVDAILGGRIVALKGLGGFQLVCDATHAAAVARLRARKRRPDKPLAVMVGSLDEVRRYCDVSDEEARILDSHQAPILLLRKRSAQVKIASRPGAEEAAQVDRDSEIDPPSSFAPIVDDVAPGNPQLGVMLPYTPLHHLLMDAVDRPIVCTSGNLSEEPMATRTADALERLGAIADVLLVHNRPIVRPVDDSVVRLGPGGVQVLRRARGYAPLPIELDEDAPTILALGGHLKNTVALSIGAQVILSPHVGDLDNVAGVEVHRRAVRDLVGFFRITPQAVACDLHPDYASTRHAEELADEWGVPLVRVQHHHAHVAACMAEHARDSLDEGGPVLGFSWDGTGYGLDGTVWGGEALRCEGAKFERVAHLRTFGLPGADRAVRQPRRSALGVLFELFGEGTAEMAARWFEPAELKTLMRMMKRSLHAPRTSSMGRLFDAVAALVGLPATVSFEGQAAMALEFAASGCHHGAYPMPVGESAPAVIDWGPLVRGVLDDLAAGMPAGRISARFHGALAEAAVTVAQRSGCSRVVLTGGCFQNALLDRLARERLTAAGFNVFTHQKVPPGDGGLALGQILVAARRLTGKDD